MRTRPNLIVAISAFLFRITEIFAQHFAAVVLWGADRLSGNFTHSAAPAGDPCPPGRSVGWN